MSDASGRAGGPTLTATPPFRLGAVVMSHGWFQTAPFSFDPASDVLRRREVLPGGPAVIAVRGARTRVEVSADRALGAPEEAEAAARVRRMLGLDHDVSGLDAAARAVDPGLADDLAAHGAGRMLAGASLFEDVVKSVAATNTTWTQAVACIARIAALDPDGAFPGPQHLIDAGEDRLRSEARVGYRAAYLLRIARLAADGTLASIEHDAPGLDGEGLAARLLALPGVGPATAGFLCLLMGRYDRPTVDSAVLRHTGAAWFGGRRPSEREVLDRIAPAGSYRGLVLAWAVMRGWQDETGLSAPA